MKQTGPNYNSYTFVFLITFSLCLFFDDARAEVSSLQENYGPQENRPHNPAKFHYSQKTSTDLTRFNGQLSKNVFSDDNSDMTAEMNMEYAHLFFPAGNGYLGFCYLSARLNNDNRVQFNSSLGQFVEAIDGDLSLSYRLLGDDLSYTLPSIGSIGDRIYENSLSANYTRYSDTFLRETSFSYNFSTIPGEEFYRTVHPLQLSTTGTSTQMVGGYGNTTSHEIGAQLAFGYEELTSSLIRGLRTSLGLGYEYVAQNGLYNYAEQTETSVSLLAAIQHKTPFGLVNTSYKHLDSSQTLYAGYSLEGLELFMKEVRYQDKKDNRLLGFLIKFDLWNPKDPFRKIKNLFKKNNSKGKGHEQIRHSMSLKSNSFINAPEVKHFIDS